jgi:hypothetical protein
LRVAKPVRVRPLSTAIDPFRLRLTRRDPIGGV